MKLKILKKTVKEGTTANGADYCIKSLYVGFSEKEVFDAIILHLQKRGASSDAIEKFCKPNDYNGTISYAFGLNCSHFTFDAVDKFGILDANIIFQINDKGFISARINVVDRKEQVNSYQAPEDLVTGWSCGNPEPAKANPEVQNVEKPEIPNLADLANLPSGDEDDLPF